MASTSVPNKAFDAPDSVADSSDANHDIHENDYREDGDIEHQSDTSSTHKQDGVEQVEALTTVWSDKMMITMFIV